MIVAAEASSALFARRLLEYWKKTEQKITAFGVGTNDMEPLGFERLGKAEEMAVVGVAEVVSQYSFLKSVFDRLVEEAARRRPHVVVLMDYPEFNLRLAKKIHELGIPVVYYVSPQIWAWRKGRIHTIKKYCQNVFLLFPFEKKFYEEHQAAHEFIGHPLLDELDPQLEDPHWQNLRRAQCGILDDEIVIGLMPGSRRSEIRNIFPTQLEAARELCRRHPKVRILILVAPTVEKEQLLPYLEDARFPYMMLKDEPFRMIAIVDFMIAASGTATLMVGLLKKPMVIVYRAAWLTVLIGRLVVKGFFGLPNLVLGRLVVPELLQEDCNPQRIVQEIEVFLKDPEAAEKKRQELGQLVHVLGDRGATARVAKSLERYFPQ